MENFTGTASLLNYGIYYLRDVNGHPKGAVGYELSNNGDGIKISLTVCSVHDTFSKPRARGIVSGRLAVGKTLTVTNVDHFHLATALNTYRPRKESHGLLKTARRQWIDITRSEYILKKVLLKCTKKTKAKS